MMMIRSLRFATVVALACALASPALAGQPVSLKGELISQDGQVTLGDLFDGAAGPAAAVLAASGRAGSNLVLDAGRVQTLARAHGLDWDNATGIRRLVIQPGSAPAPAFRLRA